MERKKRISRRQFVQTTAGAVAAGALLRKRAFAAPKPLKIGYVSPQTGDLAPFGEADTFVFDLIRKYLQPGINAGGTTRPVEILVRDSQSSTNRCAEVTADLIKKEQVNIVMGAGSPDVVNPVADQCEINRQPCITTDTPWQTWYMGRGATPDKPFDWTYHFFFGLDLVTQITCDIFGLLPTNKILGCLWPNDQQGIFESDKVHGQPPIFEAAGYKVVDPGRFMANTTDYSSEISVFKKANAELFHAVMSSSAFSNFWSQCHQQNYIPKIATVGKAFLFPAGVEALGPKLGKYLTNEIWWSPAHPFKSSLTGQTPKQICDMWDAAMHKQWPMLLGFRYTMFEVAIDSLRRAQNPDSAASVIQAIPATKINSLVGPIAWQGTPANQYVTIPVKNVCTTPLVSGQWIPGKKYPYDLVVVDNRRYPLIPVQHKMMPIT